MKQSLWIPVIAVFGTVMSGCNNLSVDANARVVSGTVTALSADRSSLTVQGQRLGLSGASITVNGRSASARAISVGQQVRVVARGDRVTGVEVSLELKGVVGGIDTTAMTITVAGVTVKYSATTRFDVSGDSDDDDTSSSSSVTNLAVGMFVEVTGATDPTTGLIVATKVEVKTPGELDNDGLDDENEIKGTVSDLSGSSFKLGEVTVNCTTPCTLPTGLKNGDFVEAEGRFDAATKTLTAKKVKFEDNDDDEDNPGTPGATVNLEDDLRRLNATTKTFKLECFVVDYSAATITGTLKERARVKVVGVVDATNTRLVKASAVTVLANDDRGGDDDDGDNSGPGGGDDDDDDGDDHGGEGPR
ncbi:MAG: hypothetical protein HC933_11980 [Pleurocapsa sp. SU_196_0]|nr:hypothetical protein [Pleurocapsa sp. SU_196_0]